MKKQPPVRKHFIVKMHPPNGEEDFAVIVEDVYSYKDAIEQAKNTSPDATPYEWAEVNKVH